MQLADYIVLAVWLTVAVVVFGAWVVAFVGKQSGRPLIDYQPRAMVPWGLAHLATTFGIWGLLQVAAAAVLRSSGLITNLHEVDELSAAQHMLVLSASSLASLLALGAALLFLASVAGANHEDLGLRLKDWKNDVMLGIRWFPMIVVPVLCIQFVLTRWIESKHPLVELVQENPTPWIIAQSFFAASLVAPLFEEYFVRVFLQGWLENLAHVIRRRPEFEGSTAFSAVFMGLEPGRQNPVADLETNPAERVEETSRRLPDSYATHAAGELATVKHVAAVPDAPIPQAYLVGPTNWPILISASLFALAHWGHGPDPIPLFVLALGLGYLYQRTHRVLPCIVVHFMLNTFSMTLLWIHVTRAGQ